MHPRISGAVFSSIQPKFYAVLSQVKYPKLALLISSYALVYVLLAGKAISFDSVFSAGYFAPFLAGFLYPFAFTSIPAAAILLSIIGGQNILLAVIIASASALISDLIIFHFIRHGFRDEVQKLAKEKPIQHLRQKVPATIQDYLLISTAGLLIASPLPTEIGVTMLASTKRITTKKFSLIAYPLHTLAILTLLLIGSSI